MSEITAPILPALTPYWIHDCAVAQGIEVEPIVSIPATLSGRNILKEHLARKLGTDPASLRIEVDPTANGRKLNALRPAADEGVPFENAIGRIGQKGDFFGVSPIWYARLPVDAVDYHLAGIAIGARFSPG